jgi:catechol 2,3-dioxygenase-like lactoylglutathione lyase family enzyme
MNTNNLFPRMHVSIYVKNIAATVEFYNNFFGQPADKVKPGYAKYVLEKPSLIISFVENAERVQQNFGHLGFQVETHEELALWQAKTLAKGLRVKEETGTNCCYALQDKFWVSDPDGVQWEVYYFHEDAEFNDPHYEIEAAEACCMPPQKAEKQKINLSELKFADSSAEACCTPGSGCC